MEIVMLGDAAAAARAAAVLRGGGVVAVPTETVYALATAWGNGSGARRIHILKHCADDRPLQMLAADLATAQSAGVQVDDRLRGLAEQFFPGALTVLCRSVHGGAIGLRIPQQPFLQALLRDLGGPLAVASANRAEEEPLLDAPALFTGLDGTPDLLVDGGPVGAGQASTIVSLLDPGWRLVRPGAITEDALRAVLAAPAGA